MIHGKKHFDLAKQFNYHMSQCSESIYCILPSLCYQKKTG